MFIPKRAFPITYKSAPNRKLIILATRYHQYHYKTIKSAQRKCLQHMNTDDTYIPTTVRNLLTCRPQMLQNQIVKLQTSFQKNKKCTENLLKLYEIICDKNSVHIKAEIKFKNDTENNTTDNVLGDHLPYKLTVLLRYNKLIFNIRNRQIL